MTAKKISKQHQASFEAIRQASQDGNESWSARDLAPLLEYQDWRNFMQVVDKARVACAQSGKRPEDHFVDTTKMVAIGSGPEHLPAPGKSIRQLESGKQQQLKKTDK